MFCIRCVPEICLFVFFTINLKQKVLLKLHFFLWRHDPTSSEHGRVTKAFCPTDACVPPAGGRDHDDVHGGGLSGSAAVLRVAQVLQEEGQAQVQGRQRARLHGRGPRDRVLPLIRCSHGLTSGQPPGGPVLTPLFGCQEVAAGL